MYPFTANRSIKDRQELKVPNATDSFYFIVWDGHVSLLRVSSQNPRTQWSAGSIWADVECSGTPQSRD